MTKLVIEADEVYSIEDAAQLIGVTPMTIFRWLKKGTIIPLKVGHRTLITKQEVERIQSERG